MGKYIIEVREIQSDHVLATPDFKKNIYISAENRKEAEQYILANLKDGYGGKFKKAGNKTKRMFGVDFVSRAGAIVLKEYKPPRFKVI